MWGRAAECRRDPIPEGFQTSHFTVSGLICNPGKWIGCPKVSLGWGLRFHIQETAQAPSAWPSGHAAAFQPDLCQVTWLDFFTYLCLGFSICKVICAFLLMRGKAMIWVKVHWRKIKVKRSSDLILLLWLKGCNYEGKLAFPNGISGSDLALPTERHYVDIFLTNKVILYKFNPARGRPQFKGTLQKNWILICLLARCILWEMYVVNCYQVVKQFDEVWTSPLIVLFTTYLSSPNIPLGNSLLSWLSEV